MKRKTIVGLGVTALVLIGIYLAVGFVVYDKLSKITAHGAEYSENIPALFKITYEKWLAFDTSPYFVSEYETISFPSRQAELNLAGWYIPGDSDAPAIILTHGLNSCKCSPNILIVAGMLHNNGFNVLVYDLREHGESDIEDGRAALGNEEYLDLLGAWDWLITEKGFEPARIGVYGQSLGAGTTLIAFGQEPRIAAVAVDSPYTNLPQIMREELGRSGYPTWLAPGGVVMAKVVGGDDLLAFNPQDAITNSAGRPIFIIHGTGDARINVHHSIDLIALGQQTGANITSWLPEGIDHVEAEYEFPQEYEQRLVKFFREALNWQ